MPTKIEWADETWNPVTGCSSVSEGCRNCYARRMARRLAGRFGYPEAPRHFDVTLHPDRLDMPLRWQKPRRIFVCSMSDLFHEDVPDEFILRVFDTIAITPQHTYLILTKRPASMLDWYEKMTSEGYLAVQEPDGRIFDNVWLGASAENQRAADERTWQLLQTPAAVHFVSLEPLLGPIDLSAWLDLSKHWSGDWQPNAPLAHTARLNWVIVGGESGPGARPMDVNWVRDIRDQCQAAGVPFFFKQHGAWLHESQLAPASEELMQDSPPWAKWHYDKAKTYHWPDGSTSYRIGKKAAGRLLNGQLWEEYPR